MGGSDLEISRLILGTADRRPLRENERADIVSAALEVGMTSVDTAPLYGFGEVEAHLGRALRGRRDQFEILSKVGLRWDSDHGDPLFTSNPPGGPPRVIRRDSRPEAIRRDVEESLQRLGTDRLDLCQIHQPDPRVPIQDSLGALEELVREGKILHVGVSNFEPPDLEASLQALGSPPLGLSLTSHQLHYSLLERRAEDRALPLAAEAGVGHLAYSPLEAGALTERMLAADPALTELSSRSHCFRPPNAGRIASALRDTVSPIAERQEATIEQVCLAWLLERPCIDGVIVGASSPAQTRRNAGADALKLTTQERAAIGERFASLRIDPTAGLSLKRRARLLARRLRDRLRRLGRGG